jgi:3-dehydroquinate dehydratase-2
VILVLNGPNLNLLGVREPGVYGTATLADAEFLVRSRAAERGFDIDFFQSNSEGALVDRVHDAYGTGAGIIVNPGGLTSTSIALLDALLAVDLPTVEVHVTNIHRRESFRQLSYVSQAAIAVIAGAGIAGYGFAVDVDADTLKALPGNNKSCRGVPKNTPATTG